MQFILYVTTIGGVIELSAANITEAVASAISQEAAAGRPGVLVIDASADDGGPGGFVPVTDATLATVPGTVLYPGKKRPVITDHG